MRPHNFYPRMPQGQGFQHYPNQMPQFQPRQMQQFQPRQTPPGMMPQGAQMPQTGAAKPGSGTFMDTASRFLSTAQSFQPLIQQATPLIQQATPMIRNLPALWKLYKGFQSTPNAKKENDYEFDDSSFYESTRKNDYNDQQYKRNDYIDKKHRENNYFDERHSRSDDIAEQPRRGAPRTSYRERDDQKSSNNRPKPSMPRIYQPPYDFF